MDNLIREIVFEWKTREGRFMAICCGVGVGVVGYLLSRSKGVRHEGTITRGVC